MMILDFSSSMIIHPRGSESVPLRKAVGFFFFLKRTAFELNTSLQKIDDFYVSNVPVQLWPTQNGQQTNQEGESSYSGP